MSTARATHNNLVLAWGGLLVRSIAVLEWMMSVIRWVLKLPKSIWETTSTGVTLFREILDIFGNALKKVAAYFVNLYEVSPVFHWIYSAIAAIGEFFQVVEAAFSYTVLKGISLIIMMFGFEPNEDMVNTIVVVITFLVLCFYLSGKRYDSIKKRKKAKARIARDKMNAAEKERHTLAERENVKDATNHAGVVAIGAVIGTLFLIATPLIGAAIGAIAGSALSEASKKPEPKEVKEEEAEEPNKDSSKIDETLIVEASLKGVFSAVIYTLLLVWIINSSSL